jgi:uncharacterized protein (DUF488 family)
LASSSSLGAIATIGVYGWTLERFLAALLDADVVRVLDVRQRRGVRGSEYAWANATRLQASLTSAGIDYRHHKELAPTTELRHLQYEEDAKERVGKRDRIALAPAYVERYSRQILDRVDLGAVVAALPEGTSALLCVERESGACHRSLIADRLASEHGATVTHLRPPS